MAGIKRQELGLNLGISSLISQEPYLFLFVPYLFPEVQSLFLEALEPGLHSHLVRKRWTEGPLPFPLPKGPQPQSQPLKLACHPADWSFPIPGT